MELTHCLGKTSAMSQCKLKPTINSRYCKKHHYMTDYTEEMLSSLNYCKKCKLTSFFKNTKCLQCTEPQGSIIEKLIIEIGKKYGDNYGINEKLKELQQLGFDKFEIIKVQKKCEKCNIIKQIGFYETLCDNCKFLPKINFNMIDKKSIICKINNCTNEYIPKYIKYCELHKDFLDPDKEKKLAIHDREGFLCIGCNVIYIEDCFTDNDKSIYQYCFYCRLNMKDNDIRKILRKNNNILRKITKFSKKNYEVYDTRKLGSDCHYCGNYSLSHIKLNKNLDYSNENIIGVCATCYKMTQHNEHTKDYDITYYCNNISNNVYIYYDFDYVNNDDVDNYYGHENFNYNNYDNNHNNNIYVNTNTDINIDTHFDVNININNNTIIPMNYYNIHYHTVPQIFIDDIKKIISKKCFFCNDTNGSNTHILDKYDILRMFNKKNTISVCMICSKLRYKNDIGTFMNHVYSVLKHNNIIHKKVDINYDNHFLTKGYIHKEIIKFCDYIRNLYNISIPIYNDNNNNNKNNLHNLVLEICETPKQNKLWLKYRNNYTPEYKFTGTKKVNYLVKNIDTTEYIGIIEITDEHLFNTVADEYIEWDLTRVINKRINNYFNLTTCISFEDNNDIKLFVQLLFTKKIYTQLTLKLEIEPVALLFTTLYGNYYGEIPYFDYAGLQLNPDLKMFVNKNLNHMLQRFLDKIQMDKNKISQCLIQNLKLVEGYLELDYSVFYGIFKGVYIGYFGTNWAEYLNCIDSKFVPNLVK